MHEWHARSDDQACPDVERGRRYQRPHSTNGTRQSIVDTPIDYRLSVLCQRKLKPPYLNPYIPGLATIGQVKTWNPTTDDSTRLVSRISRTFFQQN